MKKILMLFIALPLFFSCSSDDGNEFVEPNFPVDESITLEDVIGTFTLYKMESKDNIMTACGYSAYSLILEIEGYGFDILNCSSSSYRNGFSWTLEKGLISFKFDNTQNQKGYFSKDKWGILLIIEEGSVKKYYRNYDPIDLLTSIKLDKITNDININQSYKIGVSYSPSELTNIEFTWMVSNSNLASINNGELYTYNNSGQVKVLVQAGKLKDSIYVDIKELKAYKFGYKFGSTIADVKPEVKVSNEFAYNYSSPNGYEPPMRAFKFSNDKLVSIWSCYNVGNFNNYFFREVNTLNPPKDTFTTDEYDNLVFDKDSATWKYQDFNVLIRKGIISINGQDNSMYIIEYSQAN